MLDSPEEIVENDAVLELIQETKPEVVEKNESLNSSQNHSHSHGHEESDTSHSEAHTHSHGSEVINRKSKPSTNSVKSTVNFEKQAK
jgi:hypothetical protein